VLVALFKNENKLPDFTSLLDVEIVDQDTIIACVQNQEKKGIKKEKAEIV